MINITNKAECCGCQACVEKCPQKCILLTEDSEGFLYPEANPQKCIECHLCERVCPVINKENGRNPIDVYAAFNKNEEIRDNSSSGGVFSLLAENIIKQGGVVFGAKWNSEWEVVHGFTDSLDGLKMFRGSKYVQSNINGSYSEVEEFLKSKRKVLFSGTPCQIAGLRHFLKKNYENLLLVDIICHGVPSPGVFRQYLNELQEIASNKSDKPLKLTDINFRDKRSGWSNYHCTFSFGITTCDDDVINVYQISSPNMENVYFRGFNSDLYSRPSCNECQFRGLRSGSDITLGDFWGISDVIPEIDDNNGVSVVTINSLKGQNVFNSLVDKESRKTKYEVICKYNHSIFKSDKPHPHRSDFYSHNDWSVHQRVYTYCWPPRFRIILSKIKSILKKILFQR